MRGTAHSYRTRDERIHLMARRMRTESVITSDTLRARVRVLSAGLLIGAAACRASTLPAAMSDADFRALSESLSEPAGSFALSDNLVSNEPRFAENVRWIQPRGGVYVGVGPEQNFSYIAKLRPAAAFVIDIRRENRNLHLLYKALFEISSDRADFVSRLFSRARPAGLDASSSADAIFERYASVAASPAARGATAAIVRERLLRIHGLPLTDADLASIDDALKAFSQDGPEIQFWRSGTVKTDDPGPSYRQLMTKRDLGGQGRSFLASEASFRFVKSLQSRNLIVPVVGDFAGPAAIRRVGEYVRGRGGEIRAFYGSNVAVYLTTAQTRAFCANLATLPVASDAWFIDSDTVRPFAARLKGCAPAR